MADYAIHDTTLEAIADTIRKKDGTSALIDPADYADRINLMGMLEEKTIVSSPIADFSDGADDVPTKSLIVTIPPTLSGVSTLTETQIEGKDYLNGSTVVQGGFNINNGNNYASTTRLRTDNYIPITSGSYTIENDQSYEYVVYVYDETNAFIDAESIKTWQTYGTPFSISGNRHIRIGWRKSDNSTITAEEISGYHCYKVGTKNTYTASLGRTIYGGTADIVNGKCEPTNWLDDTLANLEQGSINGSTGANENANNRVRNASAIPFPYDEIVSSYTWTIPSGYKVAIRPYDANGNFVQLPSWALAFITQLPQDLIGQGITQMKFVLAKTDNSAITPSEMAEVGYILNKGNTAKAYSPYFAPFTFNGQEIDTMLGYNAFWSDEGDTEVTYRSSGTITQYPSGEGVSF